MRPASAFCGFYVAQADARLFNHVSQVAIVHDGDRTVVTMSNDYEGDLKEFAMVIPVPSVLQKDQIHVGDRALIQHLDAFSGPRLVEYHDPDPCERPMANLLQGISVRGMRKTADTRQAAAAELGVTIEASYTVGEYDILILSAEESDGLMNWLTRNGYRVPARAQRVLQAYIRQGLHFFVARVNIGEMKKIGAQYLRPLQMAYETPRFMLPIRLGTVNANGEQEIFVYVITRSGRVETTNYRTVKIPSGMDVPLFVKSDFGEFYKDLFEQQVKKEGMNAVFLEYAWDMSWCDPCASAPLSPDELRQLGVFWADGQSGGAAGAFLTRLHARYDAEHFPEDLVFQETGNRESFQGRYVMRHPWAGEAACEAGRKYREELLQRRREQAENLATLTGWSRARIARGMAQGEDALLPAAPPEHWWQNLWKQ